ncbi:MAG TPA: succinate dehydrogenase, cytochrome b556 subunit [Bordetella sp.]|uniref:succinate dehydrogenase, cytochrome b556 subunit n=1 Tax=Bordetella sp. TaxID=28081 RepID=UPI002ED0F0AE
MSDSAAQNVKPARPEFRNIGLSDISKYRLPLPGRLSILHRVSGLLLFLCLPLVLLPLWGTSLSSPEGYASVAKCVGYVPVKIVLLVLIWGFLHHFCAGIRFLFLDMHYGVDKASARKSAGVVFAVSLLLTLIFALKLFGAL